jgi:NADH:ubiquinone oxidoreductase subunit 4 (subunit M)
MVAFGLSLVMLAQFDQTNASLQMVERLPWFQLAGMQIDYFLGVDGLSVLLVLLTTFLTPISIISTWSAVEDRVKEFLIFFLLLEVGMVGVFLAQDIFLFYIFWEFTLVPMYFLIGIWGGPRRVYAAIKFFLYTMAGWDYLRILLGSRPHRTRRNTGQCSNVVVPGFRGRFRHQGSNVASALVASGCTRGSADSGVGHPCWCAAEDGHLRFPEVQSSAIP